ncbi:MAG: RNA pseudouridine synthase [Pirellulaceae bacterium]
MPNEFAASIVIRDAMSAEPPFPILYEDNHLLIIDKPPGIATQGVTDGNSVYDLAIGYIREKYHKPGNVYLGIVSRLDSVTSGVLMLARTSKAAGRLSEMLREGSIRKTYLAVINGSLPNPSGTLIDYVRKNDAAHRMVVCGPNDRGAQRAELDYRVVNTIDSQSLLEIELKTGRKHQIRVQLSHLGCPILGDRKYDAGAAPGTGIALHSHRLELIHPVRKSPLVVTAPIPRGWRRFKVV